jgi:hypothetical protein
MIHSDLSCDKVWDRSPHHAQWCLQWGWHLQKVSKSVSKCNKVWCNRACESQPGLRHRGARVLQNGSPWCREAICKWLLPFSHTFPLHLPYPVHPLPHACIAAGSFANPSLHVYTRSNQLHKRFRSRYNSYCVCSLAAIMGLQQYSAHKQRGLLACKYTMRLFCYDCYSSCETTQQVLFQCSYGISCMPLGIRYYIREDRLSLALLADPTMLYRHRFDLLI